MTTKPSAEYVSSNTHFGNFGVNRLLSHIPADKTYGCYWWDEFINNTFLLIIRMLVITLSIPSCLVTQ